MAKRKLVIRQREFFSGRGCVAWVVEIISQYLWEIVHFCLCVWEREHSYGKMFYYWICFPYTIVQSPISTTLDMCFYYQYKRLLCHFRSLYNVSFSYPLLISGEYIFVVVAFKKEPFLSVFASCTCCCSSSFSLSRFFMSCVRFPFIFADVWLQFAMELWTLRFMRNLFVYRHYNVVSST